MSTKLLRQGLSGAIVALLMMLFSLAAPASAQEDDSRPSETTSDTGVTSNGDSEVVNLTRPSLVRVATYWSGYINVDFNVYGDGSLVPEGDPEYVPAEWSEEVVIGGGCTGFVLNPDGQILTAGHCTVYDDSVDRDILAQYFEDNIDGQVSEETADLLWEYALANWEVEGQANGSDPDRFVDVYLTEESGDMSRDPIEARVREELPLQEGDFSLLEINTSETLTPLPIADGNPGIGTEVVSIGFPGSVDQIVDANASPSFMTGSVTGSQTLDVVPFTQIDSSMSGGMSGGPTVNLDGEVLGVNSWGPSGEPGDFNFITDTDEMRAMLERNGVDFTDGATPVASETETDAADTRSAPPRSSARPSDDGGSFPVLPVVALVILVVGGAAAFFVVRQRNNQPPTSGNGHVAAATNPVDPGDRWDPSTPVGSTDQTVEHPPPGSFS